MNLTKFLKYLLSVALLFPSVVGIKAANEPVSPESLIVESASLKREGNLMNVDILFNLGSYQLHGDRAILYTPCIVNGADTLDLVPIGIYNRNRWYHYKRSGEMLGGEEAYSFRSSKLPVTFNYGQVVAYEEWMNGSHLAIKSEVYGCCRDILSQEDLSLNAKYAEFTPSFIYPPVVVAEEQVVKTREITGRAYVDFPVNQIVIYPDFHNNTEELGKILATIQPLKNDPDITVTSIFIKGTASPEGPYANNVRLSQGRTEALKEYVGKQYNFPKDLITTDYEPVDWTGLRDYLTSGVLANGVRPEEGDLPNKAEILEIVNSDLESYARNQKIKTTYPSQYAWLLKNVYPTLRHSDYRIEYVIRNYTTVDEIAALIDSNPGKLSLNEMYLLAQSYEPGSQEFIDTFEKIAVLYPEDQQANLYSGIAAIERGDLIKGERYLEKAGDSANAIYAKANLAFLKGEYEIAKRLFQQAAETLPEAQSALQRLLDSGL